MKRESKVVRMRHEGFTLIELLVVIAIIAILAAILFPVFARAREQARKATCMSNCKQLGLATNMYLQDYDEVFPWAWSITSRAMPDGRVFSGWVIWSVVLYPYVKNMNVYVCPSDANPGLNSMDRGQNPVIGAWGKPFPTSYACNQEIIYRSTGPLAQAQLQFVADTYWIADCSGAHPVGFTSNDTGGIYGLNHINKLRLSKYPSTPSGAVLNSGGRLQLVSGSDPEACGRHMGGNLIVFADGHAKWESNRQTTGTKANPTRTTP